MPGGRSLGCKTCKQRKIKCDERQPICTQCEKGGRFCTGALTPFVYEAEMAKAEAAGASRQNSKLSRRGIRWRPVVEASSRSQSTCRKTRVRHSQSPESDLPSLVPSAISYSPSQNLAARVANVLDSTAGTGHDILILGEWLPDLTSRVGCNPALDAAMEVLLLSHRNLIDKPNRDDATLAHVYGRSLQALKAQINMKSETIGTETICAALALCTVEILSDRDLGHPAWLSHAGGSAALFQACGPDRFKTRFEKSLLYFQAPQFIGASLATRNPCFLASSEWSSLFRDDCEYLGPWDRLQARLVPVYATLPALLRDINNETNTLANTNDLLVRALELRGRLLQLEPIAQEMLNNTAMVEQVPSQYPDSPYQTYYRYRSLLVAQPLWLYWRVLIIINNTIQQLMIAPGGYLFVQEDLNASSLYAAHQLAMSAEDGRRWSPIASMLQLFNLPAAIWAFSHSGSGEWIGSPEIHWLLLLMQEFVAPLDKMYKALCVKYLDAVGLDDPNVSILTGLTPDDWAICKSEWGPLDQWEAGGYDGIRV